MKELRCTQCGASINPDTLTCEYCGSVFFSSEIVKERERRKAEKKKQEADSMFIDSNPHDNIKVRNLNDDELYNLVKTVTSNKVSEFIFPIAFMLAWTIIALIIFINVLKLSLPSGVDLITFIPLVFVIIGISATFKTIRQAFMGNMSAELNLIKQGQYREAVDSLQKKESKKHSLNFVATIILLSYFRLKVFNVAKQNIIALPQKELSELIHKSNIFMEVAKELNVRTPEFGAELFTPFKQMIKEQLNKLNIKLNDDDN